MGYDVFISYASRDKKVADAMCARLEQRGLRCWVAPRDILPGTTYGAAIINAIDQSQVMAMVLSSQSNLSRHVVKEVERAVSKGLAVIPFRIEDIVPTKDLEYFLSAEHWLDAINPPLDEHLQKLGNTVKALLTVKQPQKKVETVEQRDAAMSRFEEIAPEEWRWRKSGPLASWFKRLVEEKN